MSQLLSQLLAHRWAGRSLRLASRPPPQAPYRGGYASPSSSAAAWALARDAP
jgi:hypothetical protein